MKKISIRMKQLKTIFLLRVFSLFSKFSRKKKYWVICERGTDARDNGWHFYQYVKQNHPEIKIYYIIDKKSSDYEKVKEDAVQYGSIKNYWVVAKAEKIISSHVAMCVPYLVGKPWKYSRLGNRFYFLQHGVTSNDLDFLHKKNAKMQLFICGAKPECDFVKTKYGHKDGVVQYTGFARYDSLRNIQTRKQILVMPTWRKYIRTREEFLNSEYFNQWNTLLNDEKLNTLLRKNGFDLIFYPHYEVQKYLDCFGSGKSNIKIASFNQYDVQTLLKESMLLITDYSSVFFDFAYMKKPMIYFQFDAERFFNEHYTKGYFDYGKDGFGNVCLTVEETVEAIEENFNHQFVLDDYYSNRIKEFFPLHDQNNCQRIYEKIIEK